MNKDNFMTFVRLVYSMTLFEVRNIGGRYYFKLYLDGTWDEKEVTKEEFDALEAVEREFYHETASKN